MTEQEAFKFGFLLRCVQEQLSADEIADRVAAGLEFMPDAKALAEKVAADGISALGKLMMGGPLLATVGGGVTAAGVGGVAGYGLGKLQQTDVDKDDLKTQEIIAAYQQKADEIRRSMAHAAYRASRPTASDASFNLGLGGVMAKADQQVPVDPPPLAVGERVQITNYQFGRGGSRGVIVAIDGTQHYVNLDGMAAKQYEVFTAKDLRRIEVPRDYVG